MFKVLLISYILIFHYSKCYIFSVIISIYNSGRYLDDAIGSLVNQTIGFKNIQVILINDGSTDNSEIFCLKYQEKFPNNIIYIKIDHGGVSRARNVGLNYAKGIYINFLDADDKWDYESFRLVYLFFKLNIDLDIIGCRIKYFESKNGYHFLDYKFYRTRKVNLTREYDCIQLSASSSFFRASKIRGEKFEESAFSGEDTRFISNILLIKPIIGLIREAIYYYRKRADSTSAIQNTENNINYYFSTIKLVPQYLINKSNELYNKTIPFIQFYIGYEVLFRLMSMSYKFLNSTDYTKYCNLIEGLLKQIEDKYILEQRALSSRLQIFALSKKYNRDMRYDVILKNGVFIYSEYELVNFKKYYNIIVWRILEIKDNNELYLEGQDNCWMPREKFFYYCKLGDKIIFPSYDYYSGYNFETMYGLIEKGRVVIFSVPLENIEIQSLRFYISYMGNRIEIFPSTGIFTHLPPIINSYYATKNYILKKGNNKILYIFKYSKYLEEQFEEIYCIQLRNELKDYLVEFRQKSIKYRKKKKDNQIWLINDRRDQAGDNGEFFYRYLKSTNPKGIKFYFTIKKNCSDYKRMKQLGNIIDLDSINYLNKFLKADKIISSIIDSWVYNPFGDNGKYIRDLSHFDLIFLQSGIIKDDLSEYLNIRKVNISLFITSSKQEYNSILRSNYGYNRNNIILTGLSRFDNLLKLQNNRKIKKNILLAPTWRKFIKGTRDLVTYESVKSEQFKNTTFYKFYNDLINNEKLIDLMKSNSYTGVFCLHPNFASQWSLFTQNEIFSIKEKCCYQDELTKASLLITDYSSIFFDFGYLKKPIIYIHFDYEEYRKNHFDKGYFDYKRNGFGPVCYNIECLLKALTFELEHECIFKKVYLNRIKRFFFYIDENNNYRTFRGILKNNDKELNKSKTISLYINFVIILLILLKKLLLFI